MPLVPSLIEYASPTLAGIKVGSLFSLRTDDIDALTLQADALNARFSAKGVVLRLIPVAADRVLCYLYRPAMLAAVLSDPAVSRFLASFGYRDLSSSGAVHTLSKRLCVSGDFPHEIGVFLGYPLPDVIAFMENKGRRCLYCGCYKAYFNPAAARRMFERVTRCTSVYRKLFRAGRTLGELTVACTFCPSVSSGLPVRVPR